MTDHKTEYRGSFLDKLMDSTLYHRDDINCVVLPALCPTHTTDNANHSSPHVAQVKMA